MGTAIAKRGLPLPVVYTARGKRYREISILLFDRGPSFRPDLRGARVGARSRLSRTARLRAAASAARSVLDSREHDGTLDRVGTRPPIKKRDRSPIKRRAPAYKQAKGHLE